VIFSFLVMMSLWSYSQRILEESDFPVKIVYQNSERVIITLDQVDSLNIAFANLEECEEYEDSLHSAIEEYKEIIIKGKEVEESLAGLVKQKDAIIVESKEFNEQLKEDNNKKKKKLKFFKLSTEVLGGAVAVLLLVLLI